MPALHQRSVASGWGGVATTGAGEESDHAVTGLGPGRPLCADDSYASGRGGCCSAMGATVTEMRDDCPDQYRGEGSLCRQRSSRRRLSTVSKRVKECPRRRNPFGRGKPSCNCVHARCHLIPPLEVKEQKQNLVSTVQRILVVHAYRASRARP